MIRILHFLIFITLPALSSNAQNIQGSLKRGAFDYLVIMQIKNNGTTTVTGNLTSVEFTLASNYDLSFFRRKFLPASSGSSITMSDSSYYNFGEKRMVRYRGNVPITLAAGETLDIMQFGLIDERSGTQGEKSLSIIAGLIERTHKWSVKMDGIEVADQVNRFFNSGQMRSLYNSEESSSGSILFQFMPLPVVLKDFSVSLENQEVHLSWSTTEEANSRNFEIERSFDAKIWEKIGSVEAKGESKSVENYFLKDTFPKDGNNYYRLKMIDNDDTFAFSKIVVANLEKKSLMFPNPADGFVILNPVNGISAETVDVLDMTGHSIVRDIKVMNNKIDLSKMLTGSYLLKIVYGNGHTSFSRVVIE